MDVKSARYARGGCLYISLRKQSRGLDSPRSRVGQLFLEFLSCVLQELDILN